MNYSDNKIEYNDGMNYAKKLATAKLSAVRAEEDLFSLILDKKFNWAYPNIVHDDIKLLASAVVKNISENISLEDSINYFELYFERQLPKKENLINFMREMKFKDAKDFLKLL